MWDVILDALKDSSIAAPFLLIIYLLIEWLERNSRARQTTVRLLNGKLAPLVAGGVGLIPQCGFSVMATDLYCQNFLKLGTLIAFFVATSDEALPILLTNPDTLKVTWIVVLVKIVYAVALGYLINLFDKRNLNAVTGDLTLVEDEHGPHDHSHEYAHEHGVVGCTDKHSPANLDVADQSYQTDGQCQPGADNCDVPTNPKTGVNDISTNQKDDECETSTNQKDNGSETLTNQKAFPLREGGRCREATDEG